MRDADIPFVQRLATAVRFRPYAYIAIGVLFVPALVLNLTAAIKPAPSQHQTQLDKFPSRIGSWSTLQEGKMQSGIVDWIGLDDWIFRLYGKNYSEAVWLYAGYISQEGFSKGQDHHSPRTCFPAQGWSTLEHSLHEVRLDDNTAINIDKILVQKGEEKRLILWWFQWGDKIVAEADWGEYEVKLIWMLKWPILLSGKTRSDRSFVRISAPVQGSVEQTLEIQNEFIKAAFPELAEQFHPKLVSR